ncbi:MAG TPA: tRNA (N6-isopentenyl adenosine(37)-C2)-methylthiotransferase MiaB, partial [Bacteroidia bacterium]|nr:tRNA (N6-isopentenyl adenosine(37)-C2)-methylthiotransferase MiaB [Bacteroidia bacterium]
MCAIQDALAHHLKIVLYQYLNFQDVQARHYITRIESIKRILPDCGISTDIIAGFCSETEEEHQDTIS